jgi:hypothetical protein
MDGGVSQFEGVELVVRGLAENDVDGLESFESFEEHFGLSDGEVGTFHEGQGEVACEVGVFEVVLGVRAGGEEDDVGVVGVGGEVAEGFPLVLEVGG